jgi:hypothetical protein
VTTNIAKTINYSKYARYGRTIHWTFSLTLTASGTAGTSVDVSLPVAASATVAINGNGSVYDSSTSTNYGANLNGLTASTLQFVGDWSGTGGWGFSPNLALASGDVLYGSVTYEAAS